MGHRLTWCETRVCSLLLPLFSFRRTKGSQDRRDQPDSAIPAQNFFGKNFLLEVLNEVRGFYPLASLSCSSAD